ncbi:MAG: glycerophosphodiester phosphodiesterase family protein [Aminipila sp.]
MSSKNFDRIKKYLRQTIVVAVALAIATTLTFAETKVDDSKQEKKDYIERERTYERIIAHGGGSIEGFDTSSSVEAVMQAIKNGFKVIELDMEFSSDNKIVMLHDWDRTITTYLGRKFDDRLSLNQFNGQLICGKFKPLTFEKLTKILDAYLEVRIVTDTKGDNIKLLTQIAKNYPDYINRMIPQIYDYSEFDRVSELGYKDIIFTLYTQSTIDYDKLIKFVKENDIYAVTVAKDYWVKGLPKRLSKDGVVVYTHPISTVEEAKIEFSKGAFGIYSSNLIPKELEDNALEHYLLQADQDGEEVKLTDLVISENNIRKIKNHGNMDYKAFKYKLDGKVLEERLKEIEDSPTEKHLLNIEIWDISGINKDNSKPIYTMEYLLTKNKGKVRILDKKYEYRIDELKEPPAFESLIPQGEKSGEEEKIIDILSKSFIAKAGQYYYFNDGDRGNFTIGDELLLPQKTINGNVIIPLADAINAIGAESITMDSGRYIYINIGQNRIVSQAYSNYVRKNTYNKRISEPISLYRSKAMAGGEFIETATGREYIQEEDLMIILPEGIKVPEKLKIKLAKTAELLYKH